MNNINKENTSWTMRRWLMFTLTVFCMAVVWRGMELETETAGVAVTMSFYTLIGVMVVYVWGAITDDHISRYIESKYGVNNDKASN